MLITYISMILMSILLLQPHPGMTEEPLSGILQGVRERYSHLPGFHVSYKRKILTKSMAMLGEAGGADQATGTLFFKPPRSLKVLQETPKKEIVTTDGRTLWWYIPRKRQAYRYSSQQLGKELQLLTDIFHGLKSVENNFQVTLTGQQGGRHLLKLTPTPPWPDIQHVKLSVAEADHAIKVVEMYDYLGGMTRFTLGEIRVQKTFEAGFFEFVVPEGVRVIEGTG